MDGSRVEKERLRSIGIRHGGPKKKRLKHLEIRGTMVEVWEKKIRKLEWERDQWMTRALAAEEKLGYE